MDESTRECSVCLGEGGSSYSSGPIGWDSGLCEVCSGVVLRKITHVAIRFRGVTYSLPAPNRHYHVIRHICEVTGATTVDSRGVDQGFLDDTGKYWTRRHAKIIARKAEQLLKRASSLKELYSEDVW